MFVFLTSWDLKEQYNSFYKYWKQKSLFILPENILLNNQVHITIQDESATVWKEHVIMQGKQTIMHSTCLLPRLKMNH